MNTKKKGPGRPKLKRSAGRPKGSKNKPKQPKQPKKIDNIMIDDFNRKTEKDFQNHETSFLSLVYKKREICKLSVERIKCINHINGTRLFLLVGWLVLFAMNGLLALLSKNTFTGLQLVMIGFCIYGFIDVATSYSFSKSEAKNLREMLKRLSR